MCRAGLIAAILVLASACLCRSQQAFNLSGDYALVHDPSIAVEGGTYYVFSTPVRGDTGEFPIRCSTNLRVWKRCGYVFKQIPDWIHEASPKTRALWAPDISYFNGRYHLYYAYSSFGSNASGIALATNATLNPAGPNYHWRDEGLVLKSVASDDYNAIDPNIVLDAGGHPWLSFGSFWSGIKMRRIDPATGRPSKSDPTLYSLATRVRPPDASPARPGLPADWQAIEAPFIVRHGRFFYLFVSFDLCCRGTRSTYRIMVGRSRRVTGPYVDADGKRMLQGGGTQLLAANRRWLGPGGESIPQQPQSDVIVFHAYDAITGKPALQVSTLIWKNGWPHSAMATTGQSQ